MKIFHYKDVSQRIPVWPFYGVVIAIITANDIEQADQMFKSLFTDYLHKGQIKSTISVSFA